MSLGRPSGYTKALGERVCALLAETPYGLEHICAEHDDLPSPTTVYRWLNTYSEFERAYALAMEARAEMLLGQVVEIIDDNHGDYAWRNGKGNEPGWWGYVGENVARAKLRAETRLKLVEKLSPKKHGTQRLAVEHSGSIQITTADYDDLAGELLELIATGKLKLPNGVELLERSDDAQPEFDPEEFV